MGCTVVFLNSLRMDLNWTLPSWYPLTDGDSASLPPPSMRPSRPSTSEPLLLPRLCCSSDDVRADMDRRSMIMLLISLGVVEEGRGDADTMEGETGEEEGWWARPSKSPPPPGD